MLFASAEPKPIADPAKTKPTAEPISAAAEPVVALAPSGPAWPRG